MATSKQPKRERVYLAAPMSGYPDHNIPAINYAASILRPDFDVHVPHEDPAFGGSTTLTWVEYLSKDLDEVRVSDMVVVLDGWQDPEATGVRLEIQYAIAHGIPVFAFDDLAVNGLGEQIGWPGNEREFVKALQNGADFGWMEQFDEGLDTPAPAQPSILVQAEGLINGDRARDYDHPLDNFGRIVDLWNAYLSEKLLPTSRITEEDHALMMIMVKMARLLHSPNHRDSIVDIAGYAGTYEKVINERTKRFAEQAQQQGGSIGALLQALAVAEQADNSRVSTEA